MLKNWFKVYIYHTKNHAFFSALNMLGLSLGIAGLVFAILYWNEEHSYNKWNPYKERVFQTINILGDDIIWPHSVYPLAKFLDEMPEVEEYCFLYNYYNDDMLAYGQKKIQLKVVDTQKNFFSFFPFDIIKGNSADALPGNNNISLSEDAAKNLFGDEDPIGKELMYKDSRLVVSSVYKIQGKSSYMPAAVVNLIEVSSLKDNEDAWGNFIYNLLIKLKGDEQAEVVKEKIEKIFFEHKTKRSAQEHGVSLEEYIKRNGIAKVSLEPLSTTRLRSVVNGYPEGRGNYQFLLIMAGLSILILILSIANYVNLATANAIKRAKEVGLRKILGASKNNIVRQFLFETLVTTTVALLLAMAIVELTLPSYNNLLDTSLTIDGIQFYWQLIVVFLTVLVTAGILPAIYVANFETMKVLRGNFSRSKSGLWLRNGMLMLQFAIASFFITGSYIVYKQVNHMMNKDLGLQGEQVMEISYRYPPEDDPTVIYSRYEAVRNELKRIKGVERVAAGAFALGGSAGSSSGFTFNNVNVQAQNMALDFELLDMLEIKMADGRSLSEHISSDTVNSMLINETAAKMLNEQDIIGKVVSWNDHKLRIVGIVKDFHLTGPQAEIPPMSFFHLKTIDWMSYNLNKIYVRVSPENMQSTISAIEKLWVSKVDTEYPFTYDFVDKTYARTYNSYVKQRNLFTLLNGVVVAIALFGLFALASYSIQRRMKEIAIRKTLGAGTGTLLRHLSLQYIIFCMIGFGVASMPAWILLDKWLENFAFRIPVTILPFLIGFLVLMLLTLIVVLSKAYAASRVDVLKYLKHD